MTLAALLLPFHLTRSQQYIVGPEFERMDRHERHDRNAAPGCKVFVGDLHPNAKERDVEEIFAKFGQLKNCFVAKNPGGFGFVEFEDPADAKEAVKALDGTEINGKKIRTEISHGRRNLNKEFKTHWPGKEREERERQKKDYYDYGSSSSRRPRGYSPPHRGGSSSESEVRRLRDENARLRMELDQLRAIVGKY